MVQLTNIIFNNPIKFTNNKSICFREKGDLIIMSFLTKLFYRKKIKDSLILGLLGGLAGTLAMDVSGFILWKNKLTGGLYGHMAGSMIMSPRKVKKPRNFLIGELLHVSMGSLMSLIMVETFKKFGKDHHHLKGSIFGLFIWGVLYSFGQKMNFYSFKPQSTASGLSAIWHHLLYGITASNVILFFADPALFPDNENP